MMMTQKIQNQDDLKNEDKPKSEDDPKNEDKPKNEDDLKIKMTSEMRRCLALVGNTLTNTFHPDLSKMKTTSC